MIIRYLGHAAFLIITQNGTQIITDPYNAAGYGPTFRYETIEDKADIVTVSHGHDDHDFKGVKGEPVYVSDTGKKEIKSVVLNGVASFHDDQKGKARGRNIIFNIEADGIHVVHLGDLGHALSAEDVRKIGPVDVLLIPVGGTYTIGPETAGQVVEALKPKIVIPMHYKTDRCSFPILPADDFLKDKKYEHFKGDLEVKKENLPEETAIYLLDHVK